MSASAFRPAELLVLPAALLALALAIELSGANQNLFITLNATAATLPDPLWAFTTIWGDTLLLTACALPFAKRQPQLPWSILIAALTGGLLVQALKLGFDAPRPPATLAPDAFHLIGRALKRHSFPSGHSFTAFAFAAILIRQLQPGMAIRGLLIAGAAAVAFSRIAVGVHWPVDVLVGSALGWLAGYLSVGIARRYPWGETLAGRRFLLAFFILLAVALAFERNGFASTNWLLDLAAFNAVLFGVLQLAQLMRMRRKEIS